MVGSAHRLSAAFADGLRVFPRWSCSLDNSLGGPDELAIAEEVMPGRRGREGIIVRLRRKAGKVGPELSNEYAEAGGRAVVHGSKVLVEGGDLDCKRIPARRLVLGGGLGL